MPKLIPPENGIVVRMYRIGHGDCFLIAAPRDKSSSRPEPAGGVEGPLVARTQVANSRAGGRASWEREVPRQARDDDLLSIAAMPISTALADPARHTKCRARTAPADRSV